MSISSGDIKLEKSQVMLDTVEGGGAPTAVVVADGQSNAIFPDVSETDRALGRVNLRKLFAHVRTDNVDTFLGANMIVAEPPADPNVSVTLFSTGETFDKRADAVSRLEGYLSIGPLYPGYLFGNHIRGQRTLLVYQKTDTLPAIGATLVLTKREGFSDQYQQYVRVTEASGAMQTFEDDKGTYQRFVMTLKLSNSLNADYPGFDVSRYEYSKTTLAAATKLSDTVVADAARYYGASVLEEAGSIGDFGIKAGSMFAQLVPSAQIETPILEARSNQLQGAVNATGGSIFINDLVAPFDPVNRLFIGGAILPGSLTVSLLNGVFPPITDDGGRLVMSGAEVGAIDYENGVLSPFVTFGGASIGAAWTIDVTYTPAASLTTVSQSQGFDITVLNRSKNYVRTISPAPLKGTLSVSYMSQGRWYVLRDNGDGALRGSTTAQGAGTINFTTGTVSVTLGALPDVGSSLIYVWAESAVAPDATQLSLNNSAKVYWPFNTAGAVSLAPGPKAIKPGGLTVQWLDRTGVSRSTTDNGAGSFSGAYATGTVNYAAGTFRLSPNELPPVGTVMNVTLDSYAMTSATISLASMAGNFGATNIKPGSITLAITGQLRGQYLGNPIVNWGTPKTYQITDDGAGVLKLRMGDALISCGTVNYAAGTFLIDGDVALSTAVAVNTTLFDNVYIAGSGGVGMFKEMA